jgi:hypothetical protein
VRVSILMARRRLPPSRTMRAGPYISRRGLAAAPQDDVHPHHRFPPSSPGNRFAVVAGGASRSEPRRTTGHRSCRASFEARKERAPQDDASRRCSAAPWYLFESDSQDDGRTDLPNLSSPAAKNISLFDLVETAIERVPSRAHQEGRCASSRTWSAGCDGRFGCAGRARPRSGRRSRVVLISRR